MTKQKEDAIVYMEGSPFQRGIISPETAPEHGFKKKQKRRRKMKKKLIALLTAGVLVGSMIIFCVGVNLVWNARIRVANMLPALLAALLWPW